jgi:glycosidase
MLAATEPPGLTLGQFINQIANGRRYFGPEAGAEGIDFVLPAFIDNHDMNRFLWVAGDNQQRLRLALGLLFGLGGPPIIYYGTEVGLSQPRAKGPRHEESRHPMRWGAAQDQELLRWFRAWVHARRQHPALGRGSIRTLYYREESRAWLGELTHDRDKVLLAINAGGERCVLPLPAGSYATQAGDLVTSTGEHWIEPHTVTCFWSPTEQETALGTEPG